MSGHLSNLPPEQMTAHSGVVVGMPLPAVPLSPAVVRETMERFLEQEGWTQWRSDNLWYEAARERPALLSLGAACNKALVVAARRAEEKP